MFQPGQPARRHLVGLRQLRQLPSHPGDLRILTLRHSGQLIAHHLQAPLTVIDTPRPHQPSQQHAPQTAEVYSCTNFPSNSALSYSNFRRELATQSCVDLERHVTRLL